MSVFVRLRADLLFSFILFVIMAQVQSRNETLEKLQFPKQASISPVFKFTAGNVDEAKRVISTLGSTPSEPFCRGRLPLFCLFVCFFPLNYVYVEEVQATS